MNATQMKHKAAMEQWKQQISDCRASGLTVKAWCAHYRCKHHIDTVPAGGTVMSIDKRARDM